MSLDLEIYEANLFVRQTFLVTPHMGIPSGGHGFDEKCHKKNPLRKNRKNVFAANSNGGVVCSGRSTQARRGVYWICFATAQTFV